MAEMKPLLSETAHGVGGLQSGILWLAHGRRESLGARGVPVASARRLSLTGLAAYAALPSSIDRLPGTNL